MYTKGQSADDTNRDFYSAQEEAVRQAREVSRKSSYTRREDIPPVYHGSMRPKYIEEDQNRDLRDNESLTTRSKSHRRKKSSLLSSAGGLLSKFEEDDLLLIALIILLFNENQEDDYLIILILAILLFS